MCCGICLQTYKSEASLKKMQLDETAKFWKVLWTHVNMICVSKCLTCLFYFYKLYYEIRRLWLLKNVKSVYSFKTDNCLVLLSFQTPGWGRLGFQPDNEYKLVREVDGHNASGEACVTIRRTGLLGTDKPPSGAGGRATLSVLPLPETPQSLAVILSPARPSDGEAGVPHSPGERMVQNLLDLIVVSTRLQYSVLWEPGLVQLELNCPSGAKRDGICQISIYEHG